MRFVHQVCGCTSTSLKVRAGGPDGTKRRKGHGLPVAGERRGSGLWHATECTLGCEQLPMPSVSLTKSLLVSDSVESRVGRA